MWPNFLEVGCRGVQYLLSVNATEVCIFLEVEHCLHGVITCPLQMLPTSKNCYPFRFMLNIMFQRMTIISLEVNVKLFVFMILDPVYKLLEVACFAGDCHSGIAVQASDNQL